MSIPASIDGARSDLVTEARATMGSDAMKAFTAITADHGVLGALEGDSSLGGRADRVDLSDWGWGGDYERRGRKSEESDSGRELHCW